MDFTYFLFLFSYFGLESFILGAPTYNSRDLDVDEYLRRYGFFAESDNNYLESEEQRLKAIRLYQNYYGLAETGVIDKTTHNLMTSSRCGVPDNPETLDAYHDYRVEDKNNSFPKPMAYRLTGPKWKHKEVKWGISQYTKQLSKSEQRKTFRDALSRWQQVSGLTFTHTDSNPDIDIRFVSRIHGDGSPFDGPSSNRKGNVLAHAFPPGTGGLSGDAHFDDDERWTVDVSNKVWERKYLEKVAAHEFGHSLGLQHSNVKGALMNAYYSSSSTTYELTGDDQRAIQFLYGLPDGWVPTLGAYVPTPTPSVPSCNNLFKAIVWGSDQKAYGIYMDDVYSINDGRQSASRSRSLQDVFPGSPVEVDFALTMNKLSGDGKTTTVTYMFMGPSVWRFSSYSLDRGYPKPFRLDTFPEQPIGVTAATEQGRESIFMIGKTKWWIWDEMNSNSGVITGQEYRGYWSHQPSQYTLVTTWLDGDIYLISYNNHVRMKSRNARDGFPKKGVPSWIYQSCPGAASNSSVSFTLVLLVFISTVFHL